MSLRRSLGPARRVPSGNITSASPNASTSEAARKATRSAVPRSTGNPPSVLSTAPSSLDSHRLSLPMKRSRRPVISPAMGVSMNDRCTGASTNGPSGKFSRPSTRTRNSNLANTHAIDHAVL